MTSNTEKPLLVCIPGLLGGVEDFAFMIPEWKKHFQVEVLDPNLKQREENGLKISEEVMKEISYASSSDDVANIVRSQPQQKAYLVGVSLGGKIVYDFAIKFPELFLGALITDVGTGPFEDSELHSFVYNTVTQAPLHLPWPEMKEYLKSSIPDRSLRSLIQTQISYPNQKPPAVWKTAMRNFGAMLERQEIGHQSDLLTKVEEKLVHNKALIRVLQAERISGIGSSSLPAMKTLKCIQLIPVEGASHFIHVTHKDRILKGVIDLLPS